MKCAFLAALWLHGSTAHELSVSDLQRAKTRTPRDEYRGKGITEVSSTLNRHLIRQFQERTKDCDQWSVEDLHKLQEALWELRHPELAEIYSNVHDSRRLRFHTKEDIQNHWGKLLEVSKHSKQLRSVMRDGHCHEAVMWFVHHLSADSQQTILRENPSLSVPLLPKKSLKDERCASTDNATHLICKAAEVQDTCSWCHNQQKDPQDIPNALDPQFVGPDDGNPHGWDRQRRCDQDYKGPSGPPCGMCEGIGGIAWSDKNEDIRIPQCTVVAKPDQVDKKTVHPPIFPKQYTQSGYSEVLIGRMTDPFCFSFFPENNSTGKECYRAEEGTVYYDIDKEAAVFEYPNVHMPGAFSVFPNISSTVYHVEKIMWIVNRLWFGIEQCVCADPGKHIPTQCYPARYDFAQNAAYLGREKFEVEYLWKEMELDHFNIWAHHLWTDPNTGRVVRMWKPWNGFQVMDPEKWEDKVDPLKLVVPPPQCKKKGGAKIRISCDDDGNYKEGSHEGLELMRNVIDRLKQEHQESVFV